MGIGRDGGTPQPAEQKWLIRFLTWLMIPASILMGIVMLVWSARSEASGFLRFYALIVLLYAVVLFYARYQARQGKVRQAGGLISLGLLVVAILGGVLQPGSLPLVMLLPITAVVLALPYLPERDLRYLVILAGGVMVGLVTLTRAWLNEPTISYLATLPGGLLVVAITAITLALLQRQHNRLTVLLEQAYLANARLHALREQLAGEVQARTAALRSSEERYRTISEMTSDYVYEIELAADGTMHLGWITEAFGRDTGFDAADLAESLNNPTGFWLQIIHPEDRLEHQKHFEAACTNGESICEVRLLLKSGEIRWMRHYMRSVWDMHQQRMVRIVGAVQDITEQKREEEARLLSQKRFSLAFHSSPTPISISRLSDGCFIDVNESFVQLSGYSREEIIGHTSTDDLHIWMNSDNRESIVQHLRLHGRVRDRLCQFRAKSGEVRSLLIAIEIIELDGEACLLTTTADITERLQAEASLHEHIEALRSSEERFRNLFNHSPDGIFVLTLNGTILDANRAACMLHMARYEELVGKNFAAGDLAPPDRHDHLERLFPHVAAGEISFFEEFSQALNGQTIPIG